MVYALSNSENTTLNYSSTHRDIVLACQNGERSAQFKLYQLYNKAMFNICLRMLNNELDAEDLLQHSFVDVFSKIHTFRFESSIGDWIKRIVVNNCINFLKKRRLHFEALDDRKAQVPVVEEESTTPSHLSVQRIQEALTQLSEGYRVVFSLYAFEGYDHQEIASILGVSVATSKSQYSRAKRRLRQLLDGQQRG